MTDRNNSTVRFIYGHEHDLKDIIDPNGTKDVKNEYDDSGRLISSTDANGNKTTYQYDTQGRLIKITLPGGESTSVTYDKEGRAVSSTDAKGIVSKFVYDRAGNLTQQSVGNEVTTFTYTDNGLIETVKRGTESTKYEYNNLNQIIKKVLQDGTKIEYNHIRFCCQCLRYIQGFGGCIR